MFFTGLPLNAGLFDCVEKSPKNKSTPLSEGHRGNETPIKQSALPTMFLYIYFNGQFHYSTHLKTVNTLKIKGKTMFCFPLLKEVSEERPDALFIKYGQFPGRFLWHAYITQAAK